METRNADKKRHTVVTSTPTRGTSVGALLAAVMVGFIRTRPQREAAGELWVPLPPCLLKHPQSRSVFARSSQSRSRWTWPSPLISNGSLADHQPFPRAALAVSRAFEVAVHRQRVCCAPFFLRAALALPSSCCVHAPCLGALTARRRVSSIIGSANLETSSMDFASAMTFAWKYGCRCLPNPRHFLRISVSVILFQENRAEDDCRSHGAMLRKSSCRQDLVRRVCVSRVTVPDSYRGVLHEWRGCQCQPEEHH